MKKILTFLITLCIFMSSFGLINVSAKKCYSYNSKTKTLTISIKGKMKYDCYNAPWVNIKYPENIVFKNGLTSISDFGFSFSIHGNDGERQNNFDRIKTVKLPKTIKSIGYAAFESCKNLKKINIPKSVKKIGGCAFDGCVNLQEITIPGTVKTIAYSTFGACNKLKKVKLKNGIKTIGADAFDNCQKLKSIKIPNTVNSIGGAFSHCDALESIKLPKGLKTIKAYTLSSCKKLKKVTIQNKVTKIESRAFANCKSLKSIKIPKSVKKIGKYAFGYRDKYQPTDDNGYVDVPIKGFTIRGYGGSAAQEYADKNKFNFEKICKKGNYSYVLKGDNASIIGYNGKATSVALPSELDGHKVTEIEELAFKGSSLKSISIGKNVKYISRYAFQNSKLAKITVSGKNKKYSSKSGVLYNKKKTRLLIYPNYRKGAKFTTPSSVEQIKPYAFSGSKFLKKVVLSKKIKKISTGAFDKCKKLKSVVFKSKKKIKIAQYAFLNCKALKSVTIPKNVIKITTKSFGFTSRMDSNSYDYIYKKIKSFTIKGKYGSAAHKYAKKYKFKFVKK